LISHAARHNESNAVAELALAVVAVPLALMLKVQGLAVASNFLGYTAVDHEIDDNAAEAQHGSVP
jgi:hypothetical protein